MDINSIGAIQVLRNADGGMLLALRGGEWGSNFQKNSVT